VRPSSCSGMLRELSGLDTNATGLSAPPKCGQSERFSFRQMPEIYLTVLRSRRVIVAGAHLLLSVLVASIAATLVFLVWYPPPYADIAGGISLFGLLVSVDVVLGPTLTAVAAHPDKPARVLWRDIAVIVAIQLAAFVYGLHAITVARPVYLAFEVDRMRVVTAADIDPAALAEAPPGLRELPWSGPKVVAAAKPTKPDDVLRSIDLALAGVEISMEPRNWRAYASYSGAVWSAAQPLSALLVKYPKAVADVERIASRVGQPSESLRFLPLVSRQSSWVVVLAAPDARIVGYLPFDGFF